jgi:hypothetical protein
MRTKHLTDFADNSDFISGIYNYCDRWCERCPFTSRCLVYATENEETDDLASRDIRNAEFWRKLESALRRTREIIANWAEENGIDPNSMAAESEIAEHRCLVGEAKEHLLSVAARNYAASVNLWFETEVVELQSVDDRSDDEYENAQVINDAIAVIRWYQYQISVKTVRALTSQAEEKAKGFGDMSRDSDGSGKVALVGIDRSSSAWRILQESCTDRKESITKVLLDLERLRQGLEQAFPNARDFIRPGFDEVWSDLVS